MKTYAWPIEIKGRVTEQWKPAIYSDESGVYVKLYGKRKYAEAAAKKERAISRKHQLGLHYRAAKAGR